MLGRSTGRNRLFPTISPSTRETVSRHLSVDAFSGAPKATSLKPNQTRHDSILPRFGRDTDRAAPVWRGLWPLEFQSAALSAIERGFDLPPACVSITGRARWDG
jgi:hypothetical protein